MMGAMGVMFIVLMFTVLWQQFEWPGFWIGVLILFSIAWFWG